MAYTATELRKKIYAVLDSVLETGVPAEIVRSGRRLRIVADDHVSRLDRLEPHDIIVGDPGDLPDIHWDDSWTGANPPERP